MFPTISLFGLKGLGLILPFSSGVFYSNQVAGFLCDHPEMEGLFVPVCDGDDHPCLKELERHFLGSWETLATAEADLIDKALRLGRLDFIKVDRSKLNLSVEAWVHVVIDLPQADFYMTGFTSSDAILTWPNSD
jgi:hypothetical protein